MERDELATSLLVVLSAEHVLDEDSRIHEHFAARYQRVHQRLVVLIRQAQHAGDIPASVDASDEAQMIIAIADGVRLRHFYGPAEISMAATVRRYADRVLERWAAEVAAPRRRLPPTRSPGQRQKRAPDRE
ncbi:MAG: TetR family transcriptional regulator C-terminal domain-containing protein [Ilumatobacteraceae bacterium]